MSSRFEKRWSSMTKKKNKKLLGYKYLGFGSKPTMYQHKVNALTGALGPANSAFWKNTYKMTGPAYSLASQPLYYAPSKGVYVTSADMPAANYSVDFSNFGFGRPRRNSRKSRRGRKSRKGRKGRRSHRKSK